MVEESCTRNTQTFPACKPCLFLLDILSSFPNYGPVFQHLLGSSNGLQCSPSLNSAPSPLCTPPVFIVGPSLVMLSLKEQQHPKDYEDQASHAHPDEIPHSVVLGVGSRELWTKVKEIRILDVHPAHPLPHD